MAEEKKGIVLPKVPRKAVSINPHVLLLYSAIKIGKTTIAAQLPNSLIVELEPNGANFVDANVIQANSPNEYEAIMKQIIAEGCPYDYVIYDSATILDDWSEIVGTLDYMEKVQGKKFNRLQDGTILKPNDRRFETVHSFREGYAHSRQRMNDWFNLMSKTAKNVIILAHLKDKYVESKSGDTVEASDINLTGKVKNNYCIRADAVGHLYRNGEQGVVKFDNEFNTICGSRSTHLNGDIVISERQPDGSIKTFWENIYLKE